MLLAVSQELFLDDDLRVLAQNGINIGKFDLRRNPRGGKGVMIIELDSDVPEYVNDEIKEMDNVIDSTLLKAI